MSFMEPVTTDERDRAIAAAEINLSGLTTRQREIVQAAAKQAGTVGNRARRALGQN